MNRAAGILLCAQDTGRCLFMRRDDGAWDFPGGHRERVDGSMLDTALRELVEETGYRSDLCLARARLRVSWCPDMVLGHMWRDCKTQYTGFVDALLQGTHLFLHSPELFPELVYTP